MSIKNSIIRTILGDPVSIGLDIGSHSVKLVKIVHTPAGPKLSGAGLHVFREGTIVGGEIKNRDELLSAITTLVTKTDPTGKIKTVNFALSWSYGVIADRIKLRSVKGQSDEEIILMEAGRHSPFDVEDIQLDYKILKKDPKTGEMEVLLVASKIHVMQPYLSLIKDAGLDVINVDVDTFAAANAYHYMASPEDHDKVICIANIGQNVTNLTFIKEGLYHSTRDVSTGGSYFTHALEKELGVDLPEAILLLKGRSEGNYNTQAVQRSLRYASEELSVGLDLAFSYFQSSENNVEIDKLIITGGGANIQGLQDFLSDRHHLLVEVGNPFSKIQYDKKKFTEPIPPEIASTMMVAAGCAYRKF